MSFDICVGVQSSYLCTEFHVNRYNRCWEKYYARQFTIYYARLFTYRMGFGHVGGFGNSAINKEKSDMYYILYYVYTLIRFITADIERGYILRSRFHEHFMSHLLAVWTLSRGSLRIRINSETTIRAPPWLVQRYLFMLSAALAFRPGNARSFITSSATKGTTLLSSTLDPTRNSIHNISPRILLAHMLSENYPGSNDIR